MMIDLVVTMIKMKIPTSVVSGYDYDDNSGGGSPSDSDDDYQEEDGMIHSKVSL